MSYQFQSVSVVVVESNQTMFQLVRSVLEAFGIQNVHGAYDAESGFEAIVKHKPDVVIVDWLSLPNGTWLVSEIRQNHLSPDPFVPIIMMTGFSQKKRVETARDAGITEFIVKPYTAKTLYRKLETVIERPRQFVRSLNYFGPDRRRTDTSYQGPERRENEDINLSKVTRTAIGIRDKNKPKKGN